MLYECGRIKFAQGIKKKKKKVKAKTLESGQYEKTPKFCKQVQRRKRSWLGYQQNKDGQN